MKNYFDVKGKVAIVTGASSGLGRQFAVCLAEQGANIAILALTFTGRDKVQALFRTTKNQAKSVVENPQRINTTDFQFPGHQITRFFYISQIKI